MVGKATPLVPNKLQNPHLEWDQSESDAGAPSPHPINAFSTNINTLEDFDTPIDAFSSDHFRMFEFKVRRCPRGVSHDWTECPYSHPAEKARRRDPRKHHYSATACPEFRRRGNCNKGDKCEFSHGVFECWLHPSRYRTQPCKDGTCCRRRTCFFAHTPQQLRVVTHDAFQYGSFVSSPTSVLQDSSLLLRSMQNVQLDKVSSKPKSWWDKNYEEGTAMERVESGRDFRAKIYAKLSRENSLSAPDIGWVFELVK